MPPSSDQTAIDEVILLATLNLIRSTEFSVIVLIQSPPYHEGLEPIVDLNSIHVLEDAGEQDTGLPHNSVVD